MPDRTFTTPAQLDSVRFLKDRSVRIGFVSEKEFTSEEKVWLVDRMTEASDGWLLFRPNDEVKPDDIPAVDAEAGGKSPSQRLRAVLFLLWKHRYPNREISFENYYLARMNDFIDAVKGKLPEIAPEPDEV